jgi:hypothetical protein
MQPAVSRGANRQAIVSLMPETDLELAARFVAVLYAATKGRPGQFRPIDDCAAHAGIKRAADLKRALATADAAGFIVLHISEPMVMLTSKGREAAQPGRPARRRIATHKPKF